MENVIKNQRFGEERALYNQKDITLEKCKFQGEEDGESALKECKNVTLNKCFFDLRYPLWHDDGVKIKNCEMTENCRASLWYSSNVKISKSKLHGIKALRECSKISISDCDIISPEFGWHTKRITIKNSSLTSEYVFFGSSNIKANLLNFKGKYSFQYTKNVLIENSNLDTKDAFWHSKNATVINSTVKGEYLGWYSDGLTLINCTIIGTQPLCYCKNLKLVNCKMENTDLSFEYSDVQADILGSIQSVKNVTSGLVIADGYGEIIKTDDSIYPLNAEIKIR